MKQEYDIIKNNPLFAGISLEEFSQIYHCFEFKKLKVEKKEIVVLAGNPIHFVGIVLQGCLHITKEDIFGNRLILAEISPSEIFGETFACADISCCPVTIIAEEKTELLLFNFKKIIFMCENSCDFHYKLLQNMLQIMARKNLFLNQKIDILSQKTIREKLMCFFGYMGVGTAPFTIPYNREELAAYLGVDRSAMSAQLSQMQKEGLIRYKKNTFQVL